MTNALSGDFNALYSNLERPATKEEVDLFKKEMIMCANK